MLVSDSRQCSTHASHAALNIREGVTMTPVPNTRYNIASAVESTSFVNANISAPRQPNTKIVLTLSRKA